MKMRAAVAIFLVFGCAPNAMAQKPGAPVQKPVTPAQKPVQPAKPVVTKPAAAKATPPAAPASGAVTLLCRDLGGEASDGASSDSSMIVYERISVRDASGATVSFYAPTMLRVSNGFAPAPGHSGARGELLASGTCGMTTAVMAPPTRSDLSMQLMIAGAQSYSVTTSRNKPGGGRLSDSHTGHGVSAILPPCSTGVRRIEANRTSEVEFFVNVNAPGAVSCVE
jgi:hypothetical protein